MQICRPLSVRCNLQHLKWDQYKFKIIPTIGDIPDFEHHIIEVPDACGPRGAKGLGEHVLIPTAPAIINAITHATGAEINQLPATPDRVLAAIKIAQAD